MDVAVLYSVDCIVFEHLDSKGKIRGRRYRERIHLWRKNDVQHRVELQAHRMGMRLSHVCAWGTSKYAFDGSGVVDRHSIYHYEHGRKVYNYSLCMFQNGKIYNCDLSAAQNIGARFFLREYQLLGIEGLPATPQRTLCTLRILVSNGLPVAA
ncbi:MAG: transposase [Lachnospiraceae bacterium]|nr:transposase [Lachnospiraceae bacterium]